MKANHKKDKIISASIYFGMKNKKWIVQLHATQVRLTGPMKRIETPMFNKIIMPLKPYEWSNQEKTPGQKKLEKEIMFEMFDYLYNMIKNNDVDDNFPIYMEHDVHLMKRVYSYMQEWQETHEKALYVVLRPVIIKNYRKWHNEISLLRNMIDMGRIDIDKKNIDLKEALSDQSLNKAGEDNKENEKDEITAMMLNVYPYIHYYLESSWE